MSATCQNCGAILEDDEKFCHACGRSTKSIYGSETQSSVPPQPSAPTPNYSQPQYQQPYQQMPPYGVEMAPVMTTGEIILTMFLGNLPCIGLILLFIWAFGSETNKNKKNLARAMLIFYAIGIALYLIIVIIAVAIGVSLPTMYK